MINHFCGLQVDHKLESGRLLNRKVGRLSPAQNLGDQACLLTIDLRQARTIVGSLSLLEFEVVSEVEPFQNTKPITHLDVDWVAIFSRYDVVLPS
jgi:hypothetical protein